MGRTTDSASVTLTGAQIEKELRLSDLTVEGDVILAGAKIGGQLYMNGSTFNKTVNAQGMQVGQNLYMHEKARFEGDVILEDAKIDGYLFMYGSTFEKTVNADSLQVGQNLFMHEKARFGGDVILVGAKIDCQLVMRGSTFEKTVNGNGLQVGQNLYLDEKATFRGDVFLTDAKIDGQLVMRGSTFEKTVTGNGLQVGQDLFMDEATFQQPTSFVFAHIGSNLDLSGSTLAGLDLTGSEVVREFSLARGGSRLKWEAPDQDIPLLKLRNMRVGALQDSPDVWRALQAIDLEGFSYGNLGGFGASSEDDPRDRSIDEWKTWLAKDRGNSNRYSPRPYAQLASVLTAAGRRDHANAILFAGRERERREAWRQHHWARWLWLTVLGYLCGYGIGTYTFRVLYWVLASVAVGTAILWFLAPAAQAKGVWWCVGASLDRLLPVFQLNREFADFFNDPDYKRVSGLVKTCFAILGLWGWVLGSFLLAAVSGLTQRS